ncbi:FAD-binding oxidoreductase [bacterium]|nr:FAD-binding oxidoreductase [bacterium]
MRDRLTAIGVELREETGRATALPANAREVAAVVDLARDEGWVVTPHWAEPGDSGSVLHLSPERLCEIEEVAPADLMAVVGAGVTVAALEERIAGDWLCWPPSSFCAPGDMIGDIIARLPGGWTMEGNLARRYLLALAAVLADGSLLQAGARTVKCVTGYDLKQLMVGSSGVLGVVTSLTLRLEAVPNRESVLERYRRDFEGMAPVVGSGQPVRAHETGGAGTRTGSGDGAGETASGADGALLLLERLKRELDPDGVFPDVTDLLPGEVRS